jgi:nucleoside-diphosphate-sugar epimerase
MVDMAAHIDLLFWRDKKVFLTGHTGFKGGWLSLWLASMGAKVTGYALAPNTMPNLFDELRNPISQIFEICQACKRPCQMQNPIS